MPKEKGDKLMFEKTSMKYLAVVALIAIALALLQATSLALLPANLGGFIQGLAFGISCALAVVWLSKRYGAVRK